MLGKRKPLQVPLILSLMSILIVGSTRRGGDWLHFLDDKAMASRSCLLLVLLSSTGVQLGMFMKPQNNFALHSLTAKHWQLLLGVVNQNSQTGTGRSVALALEEDAVKKHRLVS